MIKLSCCVNIVHKGVLVYILIGCIFESQRKILNFFLPTIQFQFLVNNNMCILTQLENNLLKYEKDINNIDDMKDNEISDSFIGKNLKKMNINISEEKRERLIHCLLYGIFILNYILLY